MTAEDQVRAHFPDAVAVDDFVGWTDWALARVGFRPSNTLPLVGVCRDELMLGFTDAVGRAWGPPFLLSSLGGLVFLGRTGLAAALGHAPGEDGRHRFAAFCFAHVGVDADGTVGRVWRRGMHRPSAACGALVAFRTDLAAGRVAVTLEPDDVEQSLLRMRLLTDLRWGTLPTLPELTEVTRAAAVADVERLVDGLAADRPVDVAYLSGVVVHGPGADAVAGVHAEVVIDGVRHPLAH